ncbi:MAG: bacillithiol biosynthesis cysteine-adding enzyme BshC [Cyclobacteriaceae bacterium]
MQKENIPLDETDCFSSLFIDYINQKPELKPYYTDFPSIENFQSVIDNRNFAKTSRTVLVQALENQYDGVSVSARVTENIKSLGLENTFTVTTGHQLNIFTGPLYFIYKIVTVINACKDLKKKYPKQNFVPVYWMASEDHDFDEINHFYFDQKKYQWNTDQKGAVGKFTLTGIEEILNQLPDGIDFFKEAYAKETLAEAGRHYVNHLFGEEGIVVVDADDKSLKNLFTPVVEDDLFNHSAQKASAKDTESIQSLGYKTQVFAREINFFYLADNVRERIEKDGNDFRVVDSDIKFSEVEIRQLLKDHPEKFSPNVILRPLYQETILPNLAYVGGPSEAVYWLQLKSVFTHFKTPFPLLMPRNFALFISKDDARKWKKTGLSTSELFLSKDQAFGKWVKSNSTQDLSYATELIQIRSLYRELGEKASVVDPTLKQHLEALNATAEKKLEKAEKKLLRAEKRKHTNSQDQISAVKDVLFPGGSLQERHDNFLNFYLDNPQFIQTLLDTFDAFNYSMYLLFDENN